MVERGEGQISCGSEQKNTHSRQKAASWLDNLHKFRSPYSRTQISTRDPLTNTVQISWQLKMVHGEILKGYMIIRHACFSLSTVEIHLTVRMGLASSYASRSNEMAVCWRDSKNVERAVGSYFKVLFQNLSSGMAEKHNRARTSGILTCLKTNATVVLFLCLNGTQWRTGKFCGCWSWTLMWSNSRLTEFPKVKW